MDDIGCKCASYVCKLKLGQQLRLRQSSCNKMEGEMENSTI